MKLLLRRDQKTSFIGKKAVFVLAVRAELSDIEKSNIIKYKLGEAMLYERIKTVDPVGGLLGLALKMINLTISVDDLEKGKTVECKDIVEMLAVEEQIKEAAKTFKAILEAAAHFGGEEVIDLSSAA